MRALCDWRKEYILAQASESAKRYLSNSTLSPLDGTFAVVKDHVTVKKGVLHFYNREKNILDFCSLI